MERHEIAHFVVAGVRCLQILKAAHEESRAKEQQEAQRHLRGNQTLAQKQGATARPGDGSDSVFQRGPQIRAARTQRGNQAEDQAGENSDAQREQQNARIRCRPNEQRIPFDGHQRQQPARHRKGKRNACRTTGERQHHALHQQLAHQPAPSRAQRQPDGDFLLPREGARNK